MILTDREIQLSIDNGLILVTPNPVTTDYSATTLDLTLSNKFIKWHSLPGQPIRPGAKGYSYKQTEMRQQKIEELCYDLEPQGFVLAWTEQVIGLPITSKIAARVEGKSSIARLGIGIHVTAPTIHAGFEGPIQLELFNCGPHTIGLSAGMKICQLVFETTLGIPSSGYAGIFKNQLP